MLCKTKLTTDAPFWQHLGALFLFSRNHLEKKLLQF